MNTTLREALTRRANDIDSAHLDIDELVGLGEQRLRRRRRTAAALGGGAVAVLAIAIGVGGAALNGSNDRGTGPTGNHRTTDGDPGPNQSQVPTRPIVYSDVRFVPGRPESLLGDPIHVGGRVVETGSGWIHMDVTDDGVVYATGGYVDDGRVWFTDGGAPEQIGSHACPDAHGWPNTVVTGNSGSLAAWVDCTRTQDPELVVYDTGSGREVRERIAECGVRHAYCRPHAIIGDHVYLNWTHYPHGGYVVESLLEFDMSTGRVSTVAKLAGRGVNTFVRFTDDGAAMAQPYLDDIRSHSRAFVIGESWETGTPTLGEEVAVVGRRLVRSLEDPSIAVFDNATRRPIRLQLPPGYQADQDELGGVEFTRLQWLDDDTVALVGAGGRHDGDILTCRLSTGRCELAVPSQGYERVVPNQGLW